MTSSAPPMVSIIVPMLDERDAIGACLEALAQQTHPRDSLDVMVVDGGSTDGSREIVLDWAARADWVRLIENPQRRASSAFNRGIEAAKGEYICLVSAHGEVLPDYVERSLRVLEETGAAGVGGKLLHAGSDPAGRAIGLAMTSPFGMSSPFRYGTERREVDTIGHPVYARSVFDAVGGFDETLERNSDYELNWRIRDAGMTLVFEPAIETVYRPRSTLHGLAQQFWWYGTAKANVVRRQPRSVQLRHLAPPAAVTVVALSPLLVARPSGRRLLAGCALGYGAMLIAAFRRSDPNGHDADLPTFFAAFPIMHLAWGAGFVRSAFRGAR